MEPEAFRNSKGKVEFGGTGYAYFVPPPIPREIKYQNRVVGRLSDADQRLGRLASLGSMIPNPSQFIYPYMVREAVLSSRIEGTQATASDVFLEQAIEAGRMNAAPFDLPEDVLEVRNYLRAQEMGLAEIERRRLDLELVRDLHGVLLKGVRGERKDPGRFRTSQNWIGSDGGPLERATYVPPAPHVMKSCLADLEAYLRKPPEMPVLLQAGLLHYQFEAIHPFRDGNGRIGRLMLTLLLEERGALPVPLLYLSAFFHRNRQAYYSALRRVSEEGAYDDWLVFFLEGVSDESQDAVARAQKLVGLREKYRKALQDLDATAGAMKVLEALFMNPYVSVPEVAARLNTSYPTASRAIGYLEKASIVREFTGGRRNRMYEARELLAAMEGPASKRRREPSQQRELPLSKE